MKRITRFIDERQPGEWAQLKRVMRDKRFAKEIRRGWEAIMAHPPKLGRWIYCKYCYKSVLPAIFFDGSIVVCTQCGSGLAPMGEVLEFGSYEAWREHTVQWFHENHGSGESE